MNLDEVLEYIHDVSWLRTIPGLERELELLDRIGNPHRGMKYIHVAGTNGKGSTAAMLQNILTHAGYRTGLYTSPYILRFNERIQVDGEQISDEDVCALTEYVRSHAEAMADHPSVFEVVTAVGFEYFKRQKCDIVVLEVGMGGEWDATNVIEDNEAAVIVNIGLDHTEVLGDTLEKIAKTKSGVVKRCCPCVMYRQEKVVEDVFRQVCREMDAPFFPADFDSLRPVSAGLAGQRFDWGDMKDLRLPLLGAHQLKNAANVLTAVQVLKNRGWSIPEAAVREGLSTVTWPGRFQLMAEKPLFIIDGGHNPQCLEALENAIRAYLPGRRIVFLNGVMADKDYGDMFNRLKPFARAFVTVTPANPRALSAQALSDYIRQNLDAPATPCDTVPDGVRTAVDLAGPEGVVCACGSLYMLGEVIEEIERMKQAGAIS
ncbi:MAG: bifunctional folylpolyglutamate synthase/dihydrofolate synthase [Clostridia bacterium]|nr:bifunctional folylpolyglutamate synthase/dihydrofolate synthase [Clostridia bacterium]